MNGIVKIFHNGDGKGKGYGFITPEGGGRAIFCHVRQLHASPRELFPGDEVTFETDTDDKGLHATKVHVTSRAAEKPFKPTTKE